MKKEVVLIMLLLVGMVSAEFYFENDVYIDVNISSHFELLPLDDGVPMEPEGIMINLSAFPRLTTRQQVFGIDTYPKSVMEGDSLIYSWYSPDESYLEFGLNSLVFNQNDPIKVGYVEYFPSDSIYTSCTDRIDCDSSEIIKTAQSLVSGEKDKFMIAYKLANYVHNLIEYDIYYVGGDSASSILKEKKGVCGEYATLYAALMRSLGIPTTYVYGLVYSEDRDDYIPHNWNEVNFEGYGWIPFDSTLAQYGAIDSSHIKLKDYVDIDEDIVDFSVDGYNVRLVRNKIEKAALLRNSRRIDPVHLDIDLNLQKDMVGFGSYDLLEIGMHNPNDFYFASRIHLLLPDKIDVSEKIDSIALGPKESRTIYQLLKLDDDLDEDLTYNFSIEVLDRSGIGDSLSLIASRDYLKYSEKQIYLSLADKKEEDLRSYSENVSIQCDYPVKSHYRYDKMVANCSVSNEGSINIKDMKFCDLTCFEFDLASGETKILNSTIYFVDVGKSEQKIYLDHQKVYKPYYISLDIKDAPKINITSIKHPVSVDYTDTFAVEFKLEKVSDSIPSDLVIDFNRGDKVWRFFDFPESKTFTFEYFGSELDPGQNELPLEISYIDENGYDYHRKKIVVIELANAPFWVKIVPASMDSTYNILLVILVVLFVFIAILMIIFRPSKLPDVPEEFRDYASARFELAEDDISTLRAEIKSLHDENRELLHKLDKMEGEIKRI